MRTVKAYVVTSAIYKSLKKQMEHNSNSPGLNILSEGVQGIGKILTAHGDSGSAQPNFFDNDTNLDDDELEEIKVLSYRPI